MQQTGSMGALCALLAALFVLAPGVLGVQSTGGSTCLPPPDGLWEEVTILTLPGTQTRVTTVRAYVYMTQGLENAYIGQGSGFSFVDPQGNPTVAPVSFEFLAVFDTDACVMAGTLYSHEREISDAFYWKYDGEKMSGGSMGAANGALIFPEISCMVVSFLGETRAVTIA